MIRYLLFVIIFIVSIPAAGFAESFPVVVEAKSHAVLSAQRSGLLVEFNVDTGSKVKSGDFLAAIYYDDLNIEREGAAAQKKYWDGQASNLSNLNKSGLAPDVDKAKAVMEQSLITNKLKTIDNLIRRSKVYAPFFGIIVKRHVRPYEWVQPGQAVVEIYNPDALYFTANLPVETLKKFKSKQTNTFFIPALNKNFTAILNVFEPMVNVHSNTVKISWKVPEQTGKKEEGFLYLVPGMKGTITIE